MVKHAPVKMVDSATPGNIDRSAEVVAGYIDGDYAWSLADWHRLPGQKVVITVAGDVRANVADVENGCMTPEQAAAWIDAKEKAARPEATIYCSRSDLPAVRAACAGRSCYFWVADWTGKPHEVAGTVATQYTGDPHGGVDLSMVYSQEWLDVLEAANSPWPPW